LPAQAELLVEHLDDGELLARESRPVPNDARALDIKIHPRASHIACSLRAGDRTVKGTNIFVDCGDAIEPVRRYFIVIGAMKAGTTTLFNSLASHPAMCPTWAEVPGEGTRKEINYFRKHYRRAHTPLDYDWRFPFDPASHAWTLDVSPNYAKLMGSRSVPAHIASLGSEIKLAYILRDPIDRIESQIAHSMRDRGNVINRQHCVRVSQYALHLDGYVSHFPLSDILLLDFEQLRGNPAVVQAQICDFLGIEYYPASNRIHNKRSVRFRLDTNQREEFSEVLRPDVERLISEYGFGPAERWLRKPKRSWFQLPAFSK